MPFMRETPRSLRAYFVVVGLLATLVAVFGLVQAASLPSKYLARLVWTVVPTLLYGLDLLYAGARFRALVFGNPKHLEQVVYGSIAVVGLQLIVDLQSRVSLSGAFAKAFVGLALSLYLLTNVRRLAAEAGVPPND